MCPPRLGFGQPSNAPRAAPSQLQTGRKAVLSLALLFATLALYYPVHSYTFFDLDDDGYVYNNPHVGALDWGGIKWAFTHPFALNYDPLTLIAHSIDVQVFGIDPGAHHEVNVVLHAADAALLFWVLALATGFTTRSFMVAALFAVHPINVENVAWVSELKTMLSTLFFFLALGTYRWYARNPRRLRMMLVTFLFGLGLLVKPQIITLPFVLLLWDYWPLYRLRRGDANITGLAASAPIFAPASFSVLLKEKVPLFIVAGADAVLTLITEHKASPADWPYTLAIRLGNAILSYVRYIGKAFWPVQLAIMYPHPGFSLRWPQVGLALLCLIAVSAVVIAQRHRRYLVVGWLWFLGTMVPTIGIIQIDIPAMADRYAYIPFVGLFLMICWWVAERAEGTHVLKPALPLIGAGVLLLLAATTHHQIRYWSDSITIWTHSVQVTGHNALAHLRLSNQYRQREQRDRALEELYLADRDNPGSPGIELDIAFVEHRRKNLPQAMVYYQKVLATSGDDAVKKQVLANMGHAYGDLGDVVRAKQCYQAALRIHLSASQPQRINWQGAWWREVWALIRQHFREWRARH